MLSTIPFRATMWSLTLSLLASSLHAQAPTRLAVAREVLVEVDEADLTDIGTAVLLRSGDLVLTQFRDGVLRRVGARGGVTVIGRKGSGPGEFQIPTLAGTMGDTLWVGDVGLRRVSFFGPDRTFIRTVPYPSAGAASVPTMRWEMVLPLGFGRDGALLAEGMHAPQAPRPAGLTAAQWAGSAIVRLAPNGALQRVVAWLPPFRCSENVPVPRGDVIVRIPFCASTPRHVDQEGERIAMAVAGPGDVTHVVVLAATGDTLFAKALRLPVLPIPAALRDSARSETAQRTGARGPEFDQVMARIPSTYPAISRILNGRDGSTWIEVPVAGAEREWQRLDARGTVTGAVRLPQAATVWAAERTTLWATETDADGLMRVVRFGVRAPPADSVTRTTRAPRALKPR